MRHGSRLDPDNRFEKVQRELDPEYLEWDREYLESSSQRPITYSDDDSQSIVAENQSPDIPFRYSVNPYRGCAHGCSYCYARVSHEFLGMNAGLDFETKILVKRKAPQLFREFLNRPNWHPELIAFSGVTDCYQPAERQFQLTRQCLEVALEFRQPISIVTKNALVVRDLELLRAMAKDSLVHVYMSLTTLDKELAREMEPKTSTPAARLRAISELATAGVPVGVMTAPIIPSLNDSELPELLAEAKRAGAQTAGYILLRLPLTVEPVFIEWLQRTQSPAAKRVLSRIRQTRGGKLYQSHWAQRMTGQGEIADQIRQVFQLFSRKQGLHQPLPPQRYDRFERPLPKTGQMRMF